MRADKVQLIFAFCSLFLRKEHIITYIGLVNITYVEEQYVCEKRKETNEVVLCPNEELFQKQVIADQVHLMALDTISSPLRVTAKIRYSQGENAGMALLVDEKLIVLFDEGVRAPTPGQSLVLYDQEIVLGGGIIV